MTLDKRSLGCNSPEFTLEIRTYMASLSNNILVREWLNDGWILKISEELFWIGGFGILPESVLGPRDPQRLSPSAEIWTPDFFAASLDKSRELSSWSKAIDRLGLEKALSLEFQNQTLATSFVAWTSIDPARKVFDRSFDKIQFRMKAEAKSHASKPLEKAVPWVFLEGQTATNDKTEWLVQRLRFGFQAAKGSRARLYGRWNESEGYLGLTPEDLVAFDGGKLHTMAVAGTKSLRNETQSEIDSSSRELLRDSKEQAEHQHVVQDLEAVLKTQSNLENVVIGKVEARRFRCLVHLVTPITALVRPSSTREPQLGDAQWKIAEALHPTPALGTAPRDSTLSLLREIENLQTVSRKGFGAPFAVKLGDRLEAVVAIRQFRWKNEGRDLLKIEVGSGCGIVQASKREDEWLELAAKRGSVLQAFGLSRESRRPLGWSIEVLSRLFEVGVRRFVVCAGARNAPLVVALDAMEKQKCDIQIDSFFDERSAAFFALGLARASGAPVVVVTTSGTAVTELQSAMAEADFSGVPLIALTADRPKRLRSTGAPQSIDQNEIFARFSEASFDLEEGDTLTAGELALPLSCRRPIHLNLCFEEPLLVDLGSLDVSSVKLYQPPVGTAATADTLMLAHVLTPAEDESFRAALKRRAAGGGVAIVGGLGTDEREFVAKFILRQQLPCLLEATSGLRGDPRFSLLELKSGDRDLQHWIRTRRLAQVFRFGGIPTTRVWRDLDDPSVTTQTYSISKLRFSGMGRGELFTAGNKNWLPRLSALLNVENISTGHGTESEADLLLQDQASAGKLELVLSQVPQSEPSFVKALSEIIPNSALVYVGNSLPVRWWDWVASRKPLVEPIFANRGVNGIDGQISTAFGIASGYYSGQHSDSCYREADSGRASELWVIVGDLTALYDLSGLWAAKLVGGTKLRVVVINNSGGLIFRQVLKSSPSGSAPFESPHSLKFKNWAAMWGFFYLHCTDSSRLGDLSLPERVVLELEPDSRATEEFWRTIE